MVPIPAGKSFRSRSRREKVLGLGPGPFRNKFWCRSQSKIFWSRSCSEKIWVPVLPRLGPGRLCPSLGGTLPRSHRHCIQFFIIFSFIQFTKHKPQRHSPSYTYQESQQHKAKLITNLLSSNSIENFPYFVHQNNVYH